MNAILRHFTVFFMSRKSNGIYKGLSRSIYTPKAYKRAHVADSQEGTHGVFGKAGGAGGKLNEHRIGI